MICIYKKTFFIVLAALCSTLAIAQTPGNSYCASGATIASQGEIFDVTFGAFTNSSTCITTASGAGSVQNKYSNYTDIAPISVFKGELVPVSITTGSCFNDNGAYLKVFIDYDQDGDFTDQGELALTSSSQITFYLNPVVTGVVSIPATANTGLTRMRMVLSQASSPLTVVPCGTYSYGETEDYLMDITAPPACAGTPAPAVINGPASLCPSAGFTLMASSYTFAENVSYQWEWAQTGSNTWSPISGATTPLHNVPNGVTTATDYRLVTICNTTSVKSPSNIVTVNVFTALAEISASGPVTICPTGSVTLTANTGVFYSWSNGATTPSIVVSTADTYTVTVTSADGCKTHSQGMTVTVKNMPSIIKIKAAGPAYTCGTPVGLTIDMPASSIEGFAYQWNKDGVAIPGATALAHIATTTGDHTLTVTGVGGCTKTSASKYINVKPLPTAEFTANGATTFCKGGQVTLTAPPINDYTYTWLKNGNVNAGSGTSKMIKQPGQYTVVATQNGCKDTAGDVVTVTVHSLPVASVATADPTIVCAGDSVTLNGLPAGAVSYQWKNGTSTITTSIPVLEAKTAGTYKLAVTDVNGCVSKLSSSKVTVAVKPLPNASITVQGSAIIPANGSVKLTASAPSGATWQWYLNGAPISGSTNKAHFATTGGDYTVSVTKAGCTNISATTTIIQTSARQAIGVTNMQDTDGEAFELAAYPNPVSGSLTVRVNGIEEVSAEVYILDMNGRLMDQQSMAAHTITIDMGNYATGMYLLRYKDRLGNVGSLKLSKQ